MKQILSAYICLAAFTGSFAWAPGCAAQGEPQTGTGEIAHTPPAAVYGESGEIVPGEPLAVSIDINEHIFLADGAPSRLLHLSKPETGFAEFQLPSVSPGFYPTDLAVHGFFVYVIDEAGRAILRFDKNGAYRDVLLNFDHLAEVRRVSPYGLGVDGKGRMAVTDVENHQVLLFDSFLVLDVAFGNYGSFAGQLDSPQGVSFTPSGDVVVTDTGNKRVQYFGGGGDFLRAVPGTDDPNPLDGPRRAVVARDGTLFVADPPAGRVFVFDESGQLIRELYPGGKNVFEPADVEISVKGLLYVPDVASGKLFVFKVM